MTHKHTLLTGYIARGYTHIYTPVRHFCIIKQLLKHKNIHFTNKTYKSLPICKYLLVYCHYHAVTMTDRRS